MSASGAGGGSRAIWLAAFAPIAVSLACLAWLGPFVEARGAWLALWLAASAAWLLALRLAERAPLGATGVLAGALLLRVIALGSDGRLSDDVHRYAWEGARLAEGRSPWAASPDAPAFAAERARERELFERINHPSIPASYPPVYVGACAAVVRAAELLPERWFASPLARAVFAFRLAAALADLGVAAALVALCRRRGRPVAAAVAWAWSPLVALEFAGSAHLDALALALWIGGLAWLAARARSPLGWLAVGLAGAFKLLPFVSAAFGAREQRSLLPLALAFGVAAASLATFLALDEGARGVLAGLSEYSFRWETPNLVHRFLEGFLELFLASDEGWSDPRRVSRAAVIAAWLGYGAWLGARRVDAVAAAGRMIGAFLVLTPTLHPWYAAWIVPFLALEPRRSWSVLLALLPLAYWPLSDWVRDGAWREPAWLWPALALPFFALRVAEARAARA